MNLFSEFKQRVDNVLLKLAKEGIFPTDLNTDRVAVEPPRDAAHGDVMTNAVMVLSKFASVSSRDLAIIIAERLKDLNDISMVEIAGPGFINLRFSDDFWRAYLAKILRAGPTYGDSQIGSGEKVNIEFVSTNPTGPMHIGHGRGAVVGDVLATLLEKIGYNVTREYYVNDAGAQVDALTRSLYMRYLVVLGYKSEISLRDAIKKGEIIYGGDYLRPIAEALVEKDGTYWADVTEAEWLPQLRPYIVAQMMALIRKDLEALGVTFDVFTSEYELVKSGAVEDSLDDLEKEGLLYTGVLEPPKSKIVDDWEPRPQVLFKATEFGDDIDRPVRKSDGSWTYFATDIAYHRDKYRRGFNKQINIWGADHSGYVKRITSAVKALSHSKAKLDCKLCQMVNLLRDGQPMKMSKRADTFITLRKVIDMVSKDVVRFIMLTRKNDAHLDFDLVKVLEQSKDNPVFYVQYAHARCCSVMRHAAESFPDINLTYGTLAETDLSPLTNPAELDIVKILAVWPRLIENAALAHEPHRIAYYLNNLASSFHILWTKGKENANLRFIDFENKTRTQAHLALLQGVAMVIASGLSIFGVTPLEEMR